MEFRIPIRSRSLLYLLPINSLLYSCFAEAALNKKSMTLCNYQGKWTIKASENRSLLPKGIAKTAHYSGCFIPLMLDDDGRALSGNQTKFGIVYKWLLALVTMVLMLKAGKAEEAEGVEGGVPEEIMPSYTEQLLTSHNLPLPGLNRR